MKSKITLFAPILFLFLISLTSAQTLVAGKIYNSDYSGNIDSANVAVICNSNTLTTNSLNDGTYAVRFDVRLCNVGESVKVTATKDNLAGEGNGIISVCEGNQNCDDGLVSVVNLNLKEVAQPQNPPSGGGGGSYYYCGNGKCDSGENERTCPKDCKIVQINTTTTTQPATENTEAQETNSSAHEETEEKSFFSGITGAVTGVIGTPAGIGILIFIIAIIGIYIFVAIMRKRAKKEQ